MGRPYRRLALVRLEIMEVGTGLVAIKMERNGEIKRHILEVETKETAFKNPLSSNSNRLNCFVSNKKHEISLNQNGKMAKNNIYIYIKSILERKDKLYCHLWFRYKEIILKDLDEIWY